MRVKEYYTTKIVEVKHKITPRHKKCYHGSTTYAYIKDENGNSAFLELCPYCGETDKDAFGYDY